MWSFSRFDFKDWCRFLTYRLPKIATQILGRPQVNISANNLAKFNHVLKELQTDSCPRHVLDEQVDVAVGAQVPMKRGAEERQTSNRLLEAVFANGVQR